MCSQAPDGSKSIPVGQVIALLAEEGDDISNLEVPKDDGSKSSKEEPSKQKSADLTQTPSPQPAASEAPKHDIHVTSTRSRSTDEIGPIWDEERAAPLSARSLAATSRA